MVRRVSVGAEGAVAYWVFSLYDSPKLAVRCDLFPDDVPVGCDFEKLSIVALTNHAEAKTDRPESLGRPEAGMTSERRGPWKLWVIKLIGLALP